jgi:hypothetical protein
VMCQVGIGKASVSEPLMTCRKAEDDIKTGALKWCRDEPGGCPCIGQAVSGMKAARARSAASVWNVGKRAATPSLRTFGGKKCRRMWGARGSASSGRNREALSTVAGVRWRTGV